MGRSLPVLLTERGRRQGQLVGRSPYMQSVHLDAPADLLGRIVSLGIDSAGPNSLAGLRLERSGIRAAATTEKVF